MMIQLDDCPFGLKKLVMYPCVNVDVHVRQNEKNENESIANEKRETKRALKRKIASQVLSIQRELQLEQKESKMKNEKNRVPFAMTDKELNMKSPAKKKAAKKSLFLSKKNVGCLLPLPVDSPF